MPKRPLRRGFKTEAEEYALEFRTELGLKGYAPLAPQKLAEHLEIPLLPLSSLRQKAPESVNFLLADGTTSFSAVTVFVGLRRIVVYNDSHSLRRQANDISHEISHAVLDHPPTPPLSELGCRNFDSVVEDEANWLGATLLVPRPAALRIARLGITPAEASTEYGVSEELMRMRLNVTGAYREVGRIQARRTAPPTVGGTY